MRIFRSDLRIIMKEFEMSDKIELTVLQLHYMLEDAMVRLCHRYAKGEDVKPIIIACEIIRELFVLRKEQSNG